MAWKRACELTDLEENELKEVDLDGVTVLLIRNQDRVFAYAPLCPHMESQLSFGACDGELITCMQHLWQWKIDTGEPVGLAEEALLKYPVKIEGNDVFVEFEHELKYGYQL